MRLARHAVNGETDVIEEEAALQHCKALGSSIHGGMVVGQLGRSRLNLSRGAG